MSREYVLSVPFGMVAAINLVSVTQRKPPEDRTGSFNLSRGTIGLRREELDMLRSSNQGQAKRALSVVAAASRSTAECRRSSTTNTL
jgi:hypothetical protein